MLLSRAPSQCGYLGTTKALGQGSQGTECLLPPILRHLPSFSTMLCALGDSTESSHGPCCPLAPAWCSQTEALAVDQRAGGEEGGVDFPGSFPSESQVGRDCIPFLKAIGLLGGSLLQTQLRGRLQLSLGPSDQSLPCPLGLEVVMALQCVTIICWLPFILPAHSFVNSSFTKLALLILLACAIHFLLGPDCIS